MKNRDDELYHEELEPVDHDKEYQSLGYTGVRGAALEHLSQNAPAMSMKDREEGANRIVRYVWATGESVSRAANKLYGL